MKGRKRSLLVDTLGLGLKAVVQAAGVQNRDGGRLVGYAVQTYGPELPRFQKLWVDGAHRGAFVDWVREHLDWRVEVVQCPEQQRGVAVLATRWIVERLVAWLGNFRRLVVRYERSALNYLGFVHLGCILILLRQAR